MRNQIGLASSGRIVYYVRELSISSSSFLPPSPVPTDLLPILESFTVLVILSPSWTMWSDESPGTVDTARENDGAICSVSFLSSPVLFSPRLPYFFLFLVLISSCSFHLLHLCHCMVALLSRAMELNDKTIALSGADRLSWNSAFRKGMDVLRACLPSRMSILRSAVWGKNLSGHFHTVLLAS